MFLPITHLLFYSRCAAWFLNKQRQRIFSNKKIRKKFGFKIGGVGWGDRKLENTT